MKIDAISDLHGMNFNKIKFTDADMLIIAGDLLNENTYQEAYKMLNMIKNTPHTHKVFIAGNHDGLFEKFEPDWNEFGIDYLRNEVQIFDYGLTIAGSPMCPQFCDWYFMEPDHQLDRYWDSFIGIQPDILVTHTPPFGILDGQESGDRRGSKSLRMKVWDIQPKVHIFGHIHDGHGHLHLDGIDFYNVALLDESYHNTNPVTTIEIFT